MSKRALLCALCRSWWLVSLSCCPVVAAEFPLHEFQRPSQGQPCRKRSRHLLGAAGAIQSTSSLPSPTYRSMPAPAPETTIPDWIDLTPNLQPNPQQVDLLGQANNQCFLAMLGSSIELQPGSYQQIRIVLASDATAVKANLCGSTANCVMLSSDPSNTPQPLLLSSQSKTGLKIPSGQIAGGQFVIAAGETKDLDIDFDACASIVAQGNGQFRLKPVLHAGEVSLTSSSINGKIVDSASGQPIVGGNTVVALEQKDNSGTDRVIMETVADVNGAFVFCPVAAGSYDVVAVAVSGTQVGLWKHGNHRRATRQRVGNGATCRASGNRQVCRIDYRTDYDQHGQCRNHRRYFSVGSATDFGEQHDCPG